MGGTVPSFQFPFQFFSFLFILLRIACKKIPENNLSLILFCLLKGPPILWNVLICVQREPKGEMKILCEKYFLNVFLSDWYLETKNTFTHKFCCLMWKFYARGERRFDGTHSGWSSSSPAMQWIFIQDLQANTCALKIPNCKAVSDLYHGRAYTFQQQVLKENPWGGKLFVITFVWQSPGVCWDPWAIISMSSDTTGGPVLLGLRTLRMSVCVDFLISAKDRTRDAAFQQ